MAAEQSDNPNQDVNPDVARTYWLVASEVQDMMTKTVLDGTPLREVAALVLQRRDGWKRVAAGSREDVVAAIAESTIRESARSTIIGALHRAPADEAPVVV